jgi:protein involved in plasmid replication-relaxation
VRDATARLATSPTLNHLLATNGFFVALAAHARTRDGAQLVRWWNETRSRDACAGLVRPDGHGVWRDRGRAVPFWLETDLGTEPLSRVAGKLPGYANLGPRRAYPVLFWLPGTVREANLHSLLSRAGVPDGVTVATAAPDQAAHSGPVGPVWRLFGHPGRVALSDLPAPTMDGDTWDG